MTDWDQRFLEMAKLTAGWSKDPSTQCGSVVVDPKHRVRGVGYNGFPRGIPDNPEDYEDRNTKYHRVVHAEKNAITFSWGDLEGCSLYVWPMPPCSQCMAMIIQVGIKRVVSVRPDYVRIARWGESFQSAMGMARGAGVNVDYISL